PASDVFGLGATLYWLLTGQTPFAAPTGTQALDRARRCDIDFGAFERAGVARRLARICQHALSADPAKRPDPANLADELERAVRPWTSPRVIASIVLLAVVVAGSIWWWQASTENEPLDSKPVVHSAPDIAVVRNDEEFALSNVLPLRTGDRIAITCDVAPGEEAVVLWFDAAGRLSRFSPVRDP